MSTRVSARSSSTILRLARHTAGLTLILTLALAASASALSGSAIKVGEFAHGGPPAIAVDSAGTAYVAFADESGPPYKIQYCVIPAGASECAHSGVLVPAGGTAYVDGVKILIDGSTVVLLADVFGGSEEYEPEQEWTSTDGGATFALANGGKSVVEATLSADTVPLGAVIVPGTGVLGYSWVTAAGPPTFAAFPLASPGQCSVMEGHACPFATLQSETSEHLLSNEPGAIAGQSGSNPGVLGVYETLGKPGCSSGTFDTAFVYGSGNQSASNDYNISPGEPNSAWRVRLSPGDCEVEYPAVGGGPSGFGVVEDDLTTRSTIYHRFDQTTGSFDTPYVTIGQESEISPSVSQDGSGGIYATYLSGIANEVRLAYSPNGGTSWVGPATLHASSASQLVSSVNATGQGWATWTAGASVYAQQFVASDSITTAPDTITTSQTSGTTTGASITVPAGTLGETDRATIAGANAAFAGGTVTYSLYSSPTCGASSKVLGGGTVAVAGGVAAPSAAVTTALAPGTYYWEAAYSGDSRNDPSTSACGSEVLTVGPPATISASGSSTGTTVTVTITCEVLPCTVTITITATETTGKAAAARRKGRRRTRTVTLGVGKFTIKSRGAHKLTVSLSKAGRRFLAAHHGRANAKLLVSDRTTGGVALATRAIAIRPAKHKHRK